MQAYRPGDHQTLDGCLLVRGAPPAPGLSEGAEEKEMRNPSRSPGEEQEEGEEVET